MTTRVFGLLACLSGMMTAQALETVTLKAGYNLRETAGGAIVRTNQKRQAVVIMEGEPGAKWVKVCLGTKDAGCKGGQARWVHQRGLVGRKAVADAEAKGAARTDAGTEAACTGDCKGAKKGINRKVDPILDAVEGGEHPGYQLDRRFNAKCGKFINKKGLGEWGKNMVAAAHRVAPDCFYNRNLFGSLCPNYSDLNQPQKESVVALAFAAMAQVESTCNPKSRAKGTNDIADGIFQLEYSAGQRDDAGRDAKWCRTNQTVDTQAWDFQSECAASIVKDRICKFGAYFFGPRTYWQELRSGKGDIAQLISTTTRKWGLCKD